MEPTICKPSINKGAGIYKTGAEGGGGGSVPGVIIPQNYEQYKYLQFKNGNDYININSSFSSDYIYDIIFCDDLNYDDGREKVIMYTSYNGSMSISCVNDYYSPSFRIYGNNGGYSTKRIFNDSKVRNDFFNVVLDKNKTLVNGNPGEQDVIYNASNYNHVMIGYSDPRFCLTGKIGRLIVKNGTEKKYYFVPAFGINENKPGMYDFINDVFYPVNNDNGSIICVD